MMACNMVIRRKFAPPTHPPMRRMRSSLPALTASSARPACTVAGGQGKGGHEGQRAVRAWPGFEQQPTVPMSPLVFLTSVHGSHRHLPAVPEGQAGTHVLVLLAGTHCTLASCPAPGDERLAACGSLFACAGLLPCGGLLPCRQSELHGGGAWDTAAPAGHAGLQAGFCPCLSFSQDYIDKNNPETLAAQAKQAA